MSRIDRRFDETSRQGRAAFIPFIMAGDPTFEESLALLRALPAAGADLIELGVAFTDPMADGPIIQAAGLRALRAGQTLARTLDLVRRFRAADDATPIILMGYYNPIYAYGVARFLTDAVSAGVDGLIVVDLPPEEDAELMVPACAAGIDRIRLATPTTDEARLPAVLRHASGFVYYVSVAGITGKHAGDSASIVTAVARLKAASRLPVGVGFGIKTCEQAAEVARYADAVVVGSALVERLAPEASAATSGGLVSGRPGADSGINGVLSLARDLAGSVRSARGDRR